MWYQDGQIHPNTLLEIIVVPWMAWPRFRLTIKSQQVVNSTSMMILGASPQSPLINDIDHFGIPSPNPFVLGIGWRGGIGKGVRQLMDVDGILGYLHPR